MSNAGFVPDPPQGDLAVAVTRLVVSAFMAAPIPTGPGADMGRVVKVWVTAAADGPDSWRLTAESAPPYDVGDSGVASWPFRIVDGDDRRATEIAQRLAWHLCHVVWLYDRAVIEGQQVRQEWLTAGER